MEVVQWHCAVSEVGYCVYWFGGPLGGVNQGQLLHVSCLGLGGRSYERFANCSICSGLGGACERPKCELRLTLVSGLGLPSMRFGAHRGQVLLVWGL